MPIGSISSAPSSCRGIPGHERQAICAPHKSVAKFAQFATGDHGSPCLSVLRALLEPAATLCTGGDTHWRQKFMDRS
jgi:hypothetical protein